MKYALVLVASTLLVPSALAVNGPEVMGARGGVLNRIKHTRSEHGSVYGSMHGAPLLRRDAEADAEAYFEERAAHADAYALPEAPALSTIKVLSRMNPSTLDRTTTKLGRRFAKSTSSATSKSASTKTTKTTKKPDRVGQVINQAPGILNGVGSIVQGLDGLFRREITMEEAVMPLIHQRSAKSTSSATSKSASTKTTKTTKKPDRVGQVLNQAPDILNGVGSIVQGLDGLFRRDLTMQEAAMLHARSLHAHRRSVQGVDGLLPRHLNMEEVAFLEARDLQAAASRRRSINHMQVNQLQNKVIENSRGPPAKREAEPTQQHRPKHLRRSASVGSYFQQLERDVDNIVGTVVARDAEAEAAREITIQPDSTTSTATSASGNQVVNTVSISESAKNGTSVLETDSKKMTTQEKNGRKDRHREQKHREKLHEEKLAKEKADIKELSKSTKEMNSTATGIKEVSKQNSTANIVSAKGADLNAKPVPSIPAQVAKVAARAAEIVRSWTGSHE